MVDYGHWRGGPPFGFFFPLLIIGLIVVLVAGRRRAYWGGGPGYCGPALGRAAGTPCWPTGTSGPTVTTGALPPPAQPEHRARGRGRSAGRAPSVREDGGW